MSAREVFLYNTLSGKKEPFKPLKAGHAQIYMCGPTVYGRTHVGNARAALTGDLVTRILKEAGYNVQFVRNITDVDDKIIQVANQTGRTSESVAEEFTAAYFEEMSALNTLEPHTCPKATEHIDEIVRICENLIQANKAYVAETPFGKDVYFKVKSFEGYGKLSKRKTEDLLVGARIEPGETKEDPLDFALWKSAKPNEPSWDSPWGAGRPGWHIECSAMIERAFPEGLDIHMGGLDLIFPHHENEIAQSESHRPNRALAQYWIHNGMLVIGREKMSKSLGNIFSTRQFLDEYGGEVLKLLVFQSHYRSPVDFSEESILRTESLVERLYQAKNKCEFFKSQNAGPSSVKEIQDLEGSFLAALVDDFGSAKALGLLLKAIRHCYKVDQAADWAGLGPAFDLMERTLGILKGHPDTVLAEMRQRRLTRTGVTEARAQEIEQALRDRETARANKNFAEADRVRLSLEASGVVVMDGPDGVAWSVRIKA